MSFNWKCPNGDTKEITLENCPLYEVIVGHVKETENLRKLSDDRKME